MDYSFFQENIFFVTESSSVGFEYNSVGSILVVISPGYEELKQSVIPEPNKTNQPKYADDLYSTREISTKKVKYGEFKAGTIEGAFEILHRYAMHFKH